MAKGGLSRWFDEKWVDLSRPKEGGGFEPCGRPDAKEGKYPKCVPAARAARMSPEEIASAIRRKRRAESTERREGQKPINVPTLKKADSKKRGISSIPEPTVSKKNVPIDMELYNRVKAEAKRKFDVYPSAYANGWLVQEYKRRGGKYKTVVSKHGQHTQKDHGRRRGSARPNIAAQIASGETMAGANTPAQLQAMALEGGFTWNPKRNERRSQGVAVAPSKSTEEAHSVDDFSVRGDAIVRDYVRSHAAELAEPNAHLGAWLDKGQVYLDVSKVMPTVEQAADIGRAADQIGVFDLATFTTHFRAPNSAGEMRYLPMDTTTASGYGRTAATAMADAIGKADRGVMLIPALAIDEETIPMIVRRILKCQPISKDSPTVNAVHVPTTGKRRKRDLKRKKMRMEAALKAAKVAKHAEHNQKAHGNRSFARGGAGMLRGNLGSVTEVGYLKESTTKQTNTNPMTREARQNLKNVGERVSLEEMQEQRAKLIERYESLPKATKIQKDRYCKETKAGGRQGGELGRGNNKVRSRRKMRLLSDFGDGHTAGCAYCGVRVDYKTVEVEKLDPVVGYTDDRNLAPSCRGCNSSMGNKSVSKKTGRTFTRKFTKPRC